MNFAPVIIATLLVLTGCSASTGGSELPPYALADSIDGARIFGEGSVSTEAPGFATSITPDGRTVYFNRTDDDRSALRIYESTYGNDGWSEAVALPFSDGTYRDVDPFVSIDGDRLYFSSSRPRNGDAPTDFDTWYVERSDSDWSRPVNPGSPLNTADDEIFVTQARSGNLYFSVSGGDAFPYYFREAGLIGSRTWGGLIGITGAPPLIDGGGVTVPTFRMYSSDGEWFAEGHGVEPDIRVPEDPTLLARGVDPQLERAIEETLRLLGERPSREPVPPAREIRIAPATGGAN